MTRPRTHAVAAALAFLLAMIAFGLLQSHYSVNPYRWSNQAQESDVSRSLWIGRRNLYVVASVVTGGSSLALGCVWLFTRTRDPR